MWRLVLYALALVAAVLLAQGLLYPIVDGLATLAGVRLVEHYWLATPELLNLAAIAGTHAFMLYVIEGRGWTDVGLGRRAARLRAVAGGAALGALAIGLPSAALLGLGWLRIVDAPGGSWLGAGTALAAKLAPPALGEELLVRGYPFMVLHESAGVWPTLVASSVVFGALHLMNPGATATSVAMVALAGVFLGGVLVVTGSLWAAFAAHLAWNWTLSAVVHASVSGLPFVTPGYRTIDAGPDWITGGPWGPEGGIGAGLGMCAAMALLATSARRRGVGSPTARGERAAGAS